MQQNLAAATPARRHPNAVTFPASTVFPTRRMLDIDVGYKFQRNATGDHPWNRGFNYYTRRCIVRGFLAKHGPDPLELERQTITRAELLGLDGTASLGTDGIEMLREDANKVSGFRKFLNKFGYWLLTREEEEETDEVEQGSFVDPFDHHLREYPFFRDKFLPRYCGKQYGRKHV